MSGLIGDESLEGGKDEEGVLVCHLYLSMRIY